MKNKLLKLGSVIVPLMLVATGIAFIGLLRTAGPDDQLPEKVVPFLAGSAILMFLSVILLWYFIIFDIVHAARNPTLSGGQKAAWICAIWFLNILVIPIYGLMHFGTLKKAGGPTTPPAVP